jgi:NAD+ synthase
MSELTLNYLEVTEKCVWFLKEELRKSGLDNFLLGLSGGIDSAVVLYLLAKAVAPKNIYTFSMPYKTSNPDSTNHALECVNELGVNHQLIEITPMIDTYFQAVDLEASALRKGNKLARERMSILYDHSAKYQGLVVGTSNKSEILLGYGTHYGDTACAINPIGSLYKTQIFELAKYLGVPAGIINKRPSADLWEGQADEDELGFTYEKVDRFFYNYFDLGKSQKELDALGFSKEFILKVLAKVETSHFKRSLPTIAQL